MYFSNKSKYKSERNIQSLQYLAWSHLTADSLHEALELGERVHGLQPQLALGQRLVGLVLQQRHRPLHVGVRLLQGSAG